MNKDDIAWRAPGDMMQSDAYPPPYSPQFPQGLADLGRRGRGRCWRSTGWLGAGDHGLIGGEEDYMRAIRDAPYLVRLVKVFDRINNLQCIHTSPQPGKAQQYVEETLKYHLPLASEVDPSLAGAMRHAIDQLLARD